MAEEKKNEKLILVGMDGSEQSFHALEWALHYLTVPHDKLLIIHAQRSPSSYVVTGGTAFMMPTDMVKIFESDIKRATEKIFARAREASKAQNVVVETKAVIGDARDVICDSVKKYNPDILVLGSHGYGAIKRAVLGSVSDYCVHHAQCPVVVVKPQKN